jgi:hypothetical protein
MSVLALNIALLSLLLERQQGVNHIHNSLLQRSELDAQLSNSLGSIELVGGRKSSSGVALGSLVMQLGELFADDVANLLVAVCGVGYQVSLSSGLWLLIGLKMSFSDCNCIVSDVIEEVIMRQNENIPSRTSAYAQKEVSGTVFSEPLMSL